MSKRAVAKGRAEGGGVISSRMQISHFMNTWIHACTRAFLVRSNCQHYIRKCYQICTNAQRTREDHETSANERITFLCHFSFWHGRVVVRGTHCAISLDISRWFFLLFFSIWKSFVRSGGHKYAEPQERGRKTLYLRRICLQRTFVYLLRSSLGRTSREDTATDNVRRAYMRLSDAIYSWPRHDRRGKRIHAAVHALGKWKWFNIGERILCSAHTPTHSKREINLRLQSCVHAHRRLRTLFTLRVAEWLQLRGYLRRAT